MTQGFRFRFVKDDWLTIKPKEDSKWLNIQKRCVDSDNFRSYIFGDWIKSEYKRYKQYGNNYSTKVCYDWVKKKKDANDITDLCKVKVL